MPRLKKSDEPQVNPIRELRVFKRVLEVLRDAGEEYFVDEPSLLAEVNLLSPYVRDIEELAVFLARMEAKGFADFRKVSSLSSLREWRVTKAGLEQLELLSR